VRLLLDTHIALWAVTDSVLLPPSAALLILEADEVWVSSASVWEIAIKHALGRGDMPVSAASAMEAFLEAGYRLLDVTAPHAAAVEALPPIHRDPFDRLLVAQAQTEPLIFITADGALAGYGAGVRVLSR
jgi:PIN domain nuclease of toxin-antitoxin system